MVRMSFICVLVLLSSACVHADKDVVKNEPWVSPITIGQSVSFDSTVLEQKREINVWLPPDYEQSEARYSVIYLIDGAQDQDFHHISGLAQLATINGTFEPLIVIGVATKNRFEELTMPATDQRYIDHAPPHGHSDRFRRFIAQEIIPWVEKRYRTGPRRTLVGESLAGLFVAESFLVEPDLFTDYICISPSLWWDDQALSKRSVSLLKEHSSRPRNLYVTMADEGGTMQAGLDRLLQALEQVPLENLTWKYVDKRHTETHSSIYHESVHQALKLFFGLPKQDYGPLPWYLIEGGQPSNETQ